jgi:hypothetical protein
MVRPSLAMAACGRPALGDPQEERDVWRFRIQRRRGPEPGDGGRVVATELFFSGWIAVPDAIRDAREVFGGGERAVHRVARGVSYRQSPAAMKPAQ